MSEQVTQDLKKRITVTVPTYNEAENVQPLVHAIVQQFEGALCRYDYEILFIDNCSTDGTREKLCALCAENKRVKAIFNARNFGQFRSPFYGLCQASGDCAVLMCADFQDPVELLPALVERWEQGFAVVCAVKNKSHENPLMRAARTLYYKLWRRMSEVETIEHFTGFGLYDASFLRVLRELDDPSPYLRGIVAELGFSRTVVPYTQQKRRAGKSANNFATLYDAAMQSFATYTKAPIRAMMAVGVLSELAALVLGVLATVQLCLGTSLPWLWVGFGVALLGGMQMMGLSVLGEYLLALRAKVMRRPVVVEQQRINFEEDQ